MPAIKAYKHKGLVIPVNEAKIGKAFKCPFTDNVYSTKPAYLKHLAKYRRETIYLNNARQKWKRKAEDLWSQSSFDKIINWIETYPEFFLVNARSNGWHHERPEYNAMMDSFTIKITYLNLTYSDQVSNSHSAPVGKKQNWGGRTTYKDGTPYTRGFPGWQGSIEFELSHELPSFTSGMFDRTRIHTGTGSGGKRSRFEIKFFEEDWIGLSTALAEKNKEVDKKNTWNAVSGKSWEQVNKSFVYGKSRVNR